jgi:hypothetical protein
MDTLDRNLVRKLASVVRNEANSLEMNAGMSGLHHDGGAGRLLAMLGAWQDGLAQKVPEEFKVFVNQIEREEDPEYPDYLRLKEKFGE